jgi:hypothetical protein
MSRKELAAGFAGLAAASIMATVAMSLNAPIEHAAVPLFLVGFAVTGFFLMRD